VRANMAFNEQNTVENYVKDLLVPLGWTFTPALKLDRQESDVIIENSVKNALIRLNPTIKLDPTKAEEVLYRLRAIILSVRGSGLVKTNEELSKWLKNEKTMPFGERGEHVSINLIDYGNISNNEFIVTTQFRFIAGQSRRADLVLLINGFPLIIGEAKTPVRPAISWFDGALQLEEYQNSVPQLFVPNIFMFATEGKSYRAGAVRLPLQKWQPWRTTSESSHLDEVEKAVKLMLSPQAVLDILRNFTVFSTEKGGQKVKVLCRYQQYEATKEIIQRVLEAKIKTGLIWHFQGSGKSILMVYAAQQLRKEPALKSPTVLVVVDRVDLNSQIGATFYAADVPNTVIAETREELQRLLAQDTRKIIITTIHKFAEVEGILNNRDNIIVLVDEAHRSQEGDLGIKMRASLPNAFFFGFTGTPINQRDRNTFIAFGAKEDTNGYLSRYTFKQSIEDEATIPIDFEPRLVELHINQEELEKEYRRLLEIEGIRYDDKDGIILTKEAAKFAHLVKSQERVQKICQDIAKHFRQQIEPSGFKGQVVVYDQEACDLYKQELDKYMAPEETAVDIAVSSTEKEQLKKYAMSDDEETKLLDRFKDKKDPLKLLIVTSKLLTGFDAPINKVMYLDKPMKDHTLLQAICRVNRPYPGKYRGLIVDYIGVFDNVAQALDFDLKEMQQIVSNIDNIKAELPHAMAVCLEHFKTIDRTVEGYEGLLAAQDCLPNDEIRDKFAADYNYLNKHWETISPDPMLKQYEKDYRWLTQVYESIRPPSGRGKLLWHALGEKTLKLIHDNVTVQTIRDDLDTLVMDEHILEQISGGDTKKKAREVELKIVWRLYKHPDDPRFIELGKKLEELRDKHYRNAITSLEFLKELLKLARETVALERETKVEPVDNSKEALTKLFEESKVEKTPVIIRQIVEDIDDVVKVTRFEGWQWTVSGEREIQKALRKTLLKYQLHKEQELFDKAYKYIREHY
jgi:type I restriction enzyme R subunit